MITGWKKNMAKGKAFGIALSALVTASVSVPAAAITFPNASDLTTHLAASLFGGVGTLATVSSSGISSFCTASLLSASVVITAAHCVDEPFKFVLPAAGVGTSAQIFDIASAKVLTSYTGTGLSDVALVTLATQAVGRPTYDLYTKGDEIGQVVTMVGAGVSGLESTGYSIADGQLRWGNNRYDTTGTVLMTALGNPAGGGDMAVMDNDDGTPEHDAFGRYLGIKDLGVPGGDDGLMYGDSGGPDFINGMIVGIHSFAGSGSSFDSGTCGDPGNVDPVKSFSYYPCVDGSYGDMGGSVRVSFYADAIRAYVAAAVPEPSAWLTMTLGFGLLGVTLRRRPAAPMPRAAIGGYDDPRAMPNPSFGSHA